MTTRDATAGTPPPSKRAVRRAALSASTDPRAIRTREALLNAAEVIAERALPAAPTIGAITEQAGSTRAAFYAHFENVDDLLAACISRDLETVRVEDSRMRDDPAGTPRSASEHGIRTLFEHVLERRHLYRWALASSSPAGGSLFELVSAAMRSVVTDTAPELTVAERDLVAQFLAGGVVASIAAATQPDAVQEGHDRAAAILLAMPEWLAGPTSPTASAEGGDQP